MSAKGKNVKITILGPLLGLAIAAIFTFLSLATNIIDPLDYAFHDLLFKVKISPQKTLLNVGVSFSASNTNVSDAISIIGIDEKTLQLYGRWPFSRSHHGDLINTFSRIKDQTQRENALLLDILFFENTTDPEGDRKMIQAMKDSGEVFVESRFDFGENAPLSDEEFRSRLAAIEEKGGLIHDVGGNWQDMAPFYTLEMPLTDIALEAKGSGHASFVIDPDGKIRKQPLVAKYTYTIDELRIDDISGNPAASLKPYERFIWIDKDGAIHNIKAALTGPYLDSLAKELAGKAPTKVNPDNTEDQYYVIYKVKDVFLPSITLTLALNYLGKTTKDIDIVIGKHIRIPSPTRYDSGSGARVPYGIQVELMFTTRTAMSRNPAR